MILFAIVSGLFLCYFIVTINTKSSILSEFLFGKNEYHVYEIMDVNAGFKQNQKVK